MKKRPTRLEWEVSDENNDLEAIQSPQGDTSHHRTSKTWWRRWRLSIFVGALLLLASFIAVERLVAQAEQNIAQTEREIELAVEADSFLQDPTAQKPHIQSIELQNDLAIVHISVDEGVLSKGRPVAGGTIYYHQSAGEWERIEPNEADEADETAWGPYRFKETTHLLFQYHQVDQSMVEAVAPDIEAFTTDLHRDMGLDLLPAHEKVTVRIARVVDTQRADPFDLIDYITWDSYGSVILVPRLARVPITLASADTLPQALNATVAYQTTLFAVEKYQPQAVWRPLVDGMQLWAYSAHREFDADLAQNMNNLLRQQLVNEAPLRLPALSMVWPSLHDTEEIPDVRWQQSIVAKSIIDYIIATYGRHSLARLLEGMHQVDSWQSLIPVVFNVSMKEFENGWRTYLAAKSDLYP